MEKECCYSGRKAHHPKDLKSKLMRRLSIIEGQVRGIKKMIDNDVYCDDVLTQLAATKSALNGVSQQLFAAHLKSCIIEQMQSGSFEIVDELKQTVERMLNSK